ncbi:CvfB family protein [Maribellus mangrovi]|uniref:CvfB family protein n=1 Tax=Maribellus mangrovi TaxID=3133146 RepID=UPI0030ECF36B
MTEIGKINTLPIVRETANGVYLDGGDLGEILMPQKFVSDEHKNAGEAEVFIYTDSEDRLVATTEKPLAMVGEFAYLEVKAVTKVGAFLDWGLPKDLLVPFSEQKQRMETGRHYWVYVYLDLLTRRIAASSKLHKYLDNTPPEYKPGQEVKVIITEKTDIGYKVIINREHSGILYKNQVFREIHAGMETTAYISKVRNDEKIDVILDKPGYKKVDPVTGDILEKLKANNGFMAVSDKSSPEMIKALFGISKKTFKQAVGALYKKRLIAFDSDGIRLIGEE